MIFFHFDILKSVNREMLIIDILNKTHFPVKMHLFY